MRLVPSLLTRGNRLTNDIARLLISVTTVALICSSSLAAAESTDPRPPEPVDVFDVLAREAPQGLDDLRIIQDHVRALVQRVTPCTVGVRIGAAQGSGVIVSKDGYVLTAGHVSGAADRDVAVILHDGRTVKGKTLGSNQGIDSGMIKITDEPPKETGGWPYVELGQSKSLKAGQWCLCTGHPGGYIRGRAPVVRLGRVLQTSNGAVVSDCTLVGGDSGGPLFDMTGRVIGIHSRIGGPLTANIHVPVDTYQQTWDRLAKSEVWGGPALPGGPFVGVIPDPNAKDCRIGSLANDGPAAKAGIKVGDIVKKFAGEPIDTFQKLGELVGKKKPGDKVQIEVLRGTETVTVEVVIGRRPGN